MKTIPTVLPSSRMLAAKLIHRMGFYCGVRYMRNLGIPLEDTLLLLGFVPRT